MVGWKQALGSDPNNCVRTTRQNLKQIAEARMLPRYEGSCLGRLKKGGHPLQLLKYQEMFQLHLGTKLLCAM